MVQWEKDVIIINVEVEVAQSFDSKKLKKRTYGRII